MGRGLRNTAARKRRKAGATKSKVKVPKAVAFVDLTDNEKQRLKRIRPLLEQLDKWNELLGATLLGLTDEETPNFFTALSDKGKPLSAAVGTQQLFRHIAPKIGRTSIDREQRDYVFKPLEEVGIVQRVTVATAAELKEGEDLITYGIHKKAKSANSAYALTDEARELLLDTPEEEWDDALAAFIDEDAMRRMRARQQSAVSALEQANVGSTPHAALITTSIKALQDTVAQGFELAYIDDGDGPRGEDYEETLNDLGLAIKLKDLQPDAILVDSDSKELWFIDAVVSDGEIDTVRYEQLSQWAEEAGYSVAGAVTCYESWTKFGARQHSNKNIAPGTTVWIAEDGGKLFDVRSIEV